MLRNMFPKNLQNRRHGRFAGSRWEVLGHMVVAAIFFKRHGGFSERGDELSAASGFQVKSGPRIIKVVSFCLHLLNQHIFTYFNLLNPNCYSCDFDIDSWLVDTIS